MKFLPDTHLLMWVFDNSGRLSRTAIRLIGDPENEVYFSALSIWEAAIKSALRKKEFKVDARALRQGLLNNGYAELPITSEHAIAVLDLPPIHKDPFDRLLIAQATIEGITSSPPTARSQSIQVRFARSNTSPRVREKSTELLGRPRISCGPRS